MYDNKYALTFLYLLLLTILWFTPFDIPSAEQSDDQTPLNADTSIVLIDYEVATVTDTTLSAWVSRR